MMAVGYVRPVSYPSPLSVCTLDTIDIKLEPCDYSSQQMYEPCDLSYNMPDSKLSFLKSSKIVLDDVRDQQLTSWTSRHPQHWTREQVLDWIYYVVDQEHLDGSRVRGEAYQCLTGNELCTMSEQDFQRIDPDNGSRLYSVFRHLVNNVTFIEPRYVVDSSSLENFNRDNYSKNSTFSESVCSEAYAAATRSQDESDLVVYQKENEMEVSIPSLGTYSISPDIEFPTTHSACALFRSAALKLESSASFTSPPPSESSTVSHFEPLHSPRLTPLPPPQTQNLRTDLLPPSSTMPMSVYNSSPSFSSSPYSALMTSPMSHSYTNLTSMSSSYSCSYPSPRHSRISYTSSLSSSLSLSMSMEETRDQSLPQSTSPSSVSASHHMDLHEPVYVSDDSSSVPNYMSSSCSRDSPHQYHNHYQSPHSQHHYSTLPQGSPLVALRNGLPISPISSFAGNSTGMAGTQKKKVRKNRSQPGEMRAKNNHLWEFIRDLLHDPKTNPKLLQWEDKERGVFRFVQSDKVAELWGIKKNNKDMTYEKLSRAMRFCRSAGYFATVPKNEKFPKKLCFMFGDKSHGWK